MRRLSSSIAVAIVIVAFLLTVVAAAFDRLVVAPTLLKAEAALTAAAPSERELPPVVKAALIRSLGTQLKYLVAQRLLEASPSQIEGMKTTSRQFTELGVGLLLPLHLSTEQLLSLHASQAYMGQGVRGFAQAAGAHVGVPLAQVSPIQAAKLVVISRAPTAYLASPERLERHAQALLAKQAK
jgi:hypothetical protein